MRSIPEGGGGGKPEAAESTLRVMVEMFCRAHHGVEKGAMCPECSALYRYAVERMRRCPYGADESGCSACRTPCYRPEMRARMRVVMRYAGPRMMLEHPIMAFRHYLKRRRRRGVRRSSGG